MTLLEILNKDLIKVPLAGTTKDEIIREMLELAAKSGAVTDREQALSDIFTRESLGSTGLERGIAIPHAKTPAVEKIILAIGIKPEGVEFQSLDGSVGTSYRDPFGNRQSHQIRRLLPGAGSSPERG